MVDDTTNNSDKDNQNYGSIVQGSWIFRMCCLYGDECFGVSLFHSL